ncbi:MAG: hypothetical protein WD795_06375 [Woeseia sp.]
MPRYRSNCTIRLAMATAVTVLSACGSKEPDIRPVQHENIYVGKDPVYAALVPRGDGQWTFSRVTSSNSEPDTGYLVRLNDLDPAFDIRRAECEPRPYRENDRCNPLNPFRERDMGVVGKIVDTGISAGTGGKLSGMSRSYSTEFDHLAFNAAVDQALLLTGLDDNRLALITGLSSLAEKAAAHEAEIETLKEQMLQQYELDKEENIKIDARVSGLIQYYSDDLDPSEFVDVRANASSTVASTVEASDLSILPCDAADCIGQLNAAVASLDQKHAARLESLRSDLTRQTEAYIIDCSATEYSGYHFELHCPEKLARNQEGLILLPVEVEILSRDFEYLFPEFSAENGELSAAVYQGSLMLKNRTGEFVDIQSVSIYYNSQISTRSELDSRLDLAPYQYTEMAVAELVSDAIEIESRHTNMTPDKASRANFSFGLAVKYSLHDRDAIETLYGMDDFNVQCAIESRLQPGSCRQELTQDTGEEAVSSND